MKRFSLALGIAILLGVLLFAACTVTSEPDVSTRGSGSITGVTAVIGGGFGSTGCTLSSAGNMQCDGAATIGGNATVTGTAAISATTIGGGFGSTGCTISSAGVLQCNGASTIGGAQTVTGTLNANGGLAVDTSAFVVANTSGNTQIAGTLGVTGTSTLVGAVSISGATTLAGLNKITAGTSITVTNGAAFALTATFQPITAAGTVTPTITIPAAGVYACIYNTSAQTVNIADTGNQVLSAAWAGTQYATLCGYSDGTRFLEISRSIN